MVRDVPVERNTKGWLRGGLILIYLAAQPVFSSAQSQPDSTEYPVTSVLLKELVVSAGVAEMNVDSFVQQVIEDTSFYQAFLNMKYFEHQLQGSVQCFYTDLSDRGGVDKSGRLVLSDLKTHVVVEREKLQGKVRKKNGKWKFATLQMYNDIFFDEKPSRPARYATSRSFEQHNRGRMERYETQLKEFLFNPGKPVESVPLIGDKLALFSEEMRPYYDYTLFQMQIDGREVIALSCKAKPGTDRNDTVIKELPSYFYKDYGVVVKRDYHLDYGNLLFDFNIKMSVTNQMQRGEILPVSIRYDGIWDVPLMKAEHVRFSLNCSDYQLR